jgi:hypothetical protein
VDRFEEHEVGALTRVVPNRILKKVLLFSSPRI